MAFHLRVNSRKLLSAVAQLGSAQCRAGAGTSTCTRGLTESSACAPRQVRQFTAVGPSWAAAASGTGPLVENMQDKIREGLGGADEVEVIDVSGDARHVSIRVVSEAFEGKSPINRQRLVYKCIWEEMQSERVHAVQGIETKTPAEVSK